MHYRHLELGAEMVEHEGWMLPARYSDPEEEAARVREAVGITDISPVGKIRLQGESVDQALREALPDHQATPVGSVFTTSDDASDTLVARLADDDYLVITGSASVGNVLDSLNLDGCVHPVNVTSVLAAVRIIGPKTAAVLAGVTNLDLAPPYFPNLSCAQTMVAEIHGTIIRRDIGELLSYDLFFGRDYGDHMWESLIDAGQRHGLTPFGLEARHALCGEI
jgi:sarcosine oxidase subunit alpha